MKFNAINKTQYGYYVNVKFSAKPELIEMEPLDVSYDEGAWKYYSKVSTEFSENFDDNSKAAKKFWKDYKKAVVGVAALHDVEVSFNYEWVDEEFNLELVEDNFVPPPPPTHYTKEEVLAAVKQALPNANAELINTLWKAL